MPALGVLVRKGKIITAVLVGAAVLLALSGAWALVLFAAIGVQAGRIIATVLERRAASRSRVDAEP